MSDSKVPEGLGTFAQVLSEDADLRAWFDSFADAPEEQREETFRMLAEKMRAAGEHPDMIVATALLARAGTYDAVSAFLRDIDGEQ